MSAVTVACVLRSGGDYGPEHVRALYRGVARHWPTDGPFLDFLCLTDTPIRQFGVREVRLIGDWPGWWAKLELFRPDLGDAPLLFFDLDTVVVGALADLADASRLVILRDFYRKRGLQSALMRIPAEERAEVWREWLRDPRGHIRQHRSDQDFLETLWLGRAQLWQDLLPGQVVSYKVHVRGKPQPPAGARVVCYHGQPRPWETELWAG